ncbi:MAG: energy transducer TonB [Bdellovibrio sp.]|nr:energy transducer TonB [Bdellovibrio sp.]
MPVIRAVLFSSFFHILLIGAVLWLAPRFTVTPPETIEVALFPEGQILEALTPKTEKKQVVRQTLAPEKLKAPDDETLARFLSEQKQRVREETQAAQSGMTENRSNQGTAQNKKNAPSEKTTTSRGEDQDKDGYRTVDISKELQEMNRFNDGMSTIGESMPRDVKVGSFTALNTDRYLFYTFYARMEELIRFRWETRVQQAINNFDHNTLTSVGNRNWVTHVEFLLDKNGFLRSALVMKESGIKSFDAAAINAFKDARVFPNPPQEMVQDDGFIHIKFSFTVNYNPPVLVNRN